MKTSQLLIKDFLDDGVILENGFWTKISDIERIKMNKKIKNGN